MPVNKRQELYFAAIVFILLTVHFFGNGLAYFDVANEIEENCSGWSGCSTLEEELIEEAEWNGVIELFISVIMVGLVFFFWPQLTSEEKQKRDSEIKERERQWKKGEGSEKVRFKEAYRSGDLSKIGPWELVRYRQYAVWEDEKKELRGQKEDNILGLNENSDESE